MPNWCNNQVRMGGPTKEIKRIWDILEDDKTDNGLLSAIAPLDGDWEYNDAVNLYHKLFEQFGDYSTMCVSGKSVVFPKGLYQNTTSDLYAWGYEATNSLWEYYKNTCNSELGDFAEIPHTSIQYSKFNFLQSYVDSKHIDDFQIRCKMCLVDITNDNPIEWNILQC